MPFQSEKQRKYLWANEPEIARDWTDKYGSRVKKQEGGIMEYLQNMNLGDVGLYGGTALGALGAGAGWQSMQDINAINRMAASGNYGVGNKMPQAFMDKLKGAYTPSSVFKKTGYPTGLKNWFLSRSSPGHFSPVETTRNIGRQLGKHLGGWGGAALTGLPLAYTYGASKLQESLPMSLIGPGGIAEQNPYFGAMGVSVNPKTEETLRYGDTKEDMSIEELRDYFQDIAPEDLGLPKRGEADWEKYMRGQIADVPRLSNEAWLAEADKRHLTASNPNVMKDFRYSTDDKQPFKYDDTDDDEKALSYAIKRSAPRKMGMLEKLRNRFYKPAAGAVNYGGKTYSPAQLNSMNALGGYYSEPARDARRLGQRRINILNRAKAGKPIGNVNLLKDYKKSPSGGITFTGTSEGGANVGAGYSRSDSGWDRSPFRKGGLASLWQK